MNVQLFRRLPRGVELTSAGQALLPEAKSILAHCDRALETTLRAARGEQGNLCVGVSPTSSFHPLVPDAIRSFREKFPHVSVTLEECLTAEILPRVLSEQMDVAFFDPKVRRRRARGQAAADGTDGGGTAAWTRICTTAAARS